MRVIYTFLFVAFILNSCSKEDNALGRNGENGKAVGASAKDLLTPNYSNLKIEIQYMPGFQPTAAAVANLQAFLEALLHKPGGISIIQSEIPASGRTTLTMDDIADIEKEYRTVFTQGNQLGVYFLFTNGVSSTANVLGVAYKNTSMCLFGKTIQENSGGLLMPSRDKLETTVLEHEFGHILGLVDLGSRMVTEHRDEAHGSHCDNSQCLMYYQANTTDIVANLTNGVPALDNNCRADLRANGGK